MGTDGRILKRAATTENNGIGIRLPAAKRRFTIDGSDALETHLAEICGCVSDSVAKLIPKRKIQGLLLGGGYGRGEGGVLETQNGDRPYNDLEFFLLLRGSCRLNEKIFLPRLAQLAKELAPRAGVEIEIKILSLEKLEQSPVTMAFYDLVEGHRVLRGPKNLLRRCRHHSSATAIPLWEATRLLMNRCSGLLFAAERLQRRRFTPEDADFVGRNHAKAQLAFGDVILTANGLYHSSCRERHARLQKFLPMENWPWFDDLREHHRRGVELKLHPRRENIGPENFLELQRELSLFGLRIWLWLESRRLGHVFSSPWDYVISGVNKCPETSLRRNFLINLWRFGAAGCFSKHAFRYPRERLFHSLSLLLWETAMLDNSFFLRQVQRELKTNGSNFRELVAVYSKLWRCFN